MPTSQSLRRTVRRWRRGAARRLDPAAYRKLATQKAGGRSRTVPHEPARPRWVREVPPALDPPPPMSRHEFLGRLHELLDPRTYVEVGVNDGRSLTLSRCRTVAVDPVLQVASELRCDLHLIRATSDELFARPDPLEHLAGTPVDLAFVDGMHLAEFAYRDVMNVERFLAPTGVIFIDDMLPRTVAEAARERATHDWAGDVYKVGLLLRELRPDLVTIMINTSPTGTVLVAGVDPGSTGLGDAYESVLARLTAPDPQAVPDEILSRTGAIDPREVLASPVWAQLRRLRDAGADRAQVAAALEPWRAWVR